MVVDRLCSVLFTACLFALPSLAKAQPVSDVSEWAQKFQDAALRSDLDEEQNLITEASDPRVKFDHIMESISKAIERKRVVSVEQFNNQSLGTFFKRVNFAVLLEHSILFYSFEFAREVDGWQIFGVGADGNVNHILARQWPG